MCARKAAQRIQLETSLTHNGMIESEPVPLNGVTMYVSPWPRLAGGARERLWTVVMHSALMKAEAPQWSGRLTRGSRTLKVVEPSSTVMTRVTVTTVPRSATSAC